MVSEAALTLLKTHEGLRLTAYRCPAGVWTIGYGHTGADVTAGLTITATRADALLRADVDRFSVAVAEICPAATLPEHSALVCLAYNIGLGAFRKSSVARLHNARRRPEAAQAFALWNKAKGRVLAGLVKRRAAEAALYLSEDNAPMPGRIAVDGATPLAKSKQVIGASIGGGATLAAQILEEIDWVKQQLAELAPYLPAVSKALVLVGVLGMALALYGRWKQHLEGRA